MVPQGAVIPSSMRQVSRRLVAKVSEHGIEVVPRLKTGVENLDRLYGGEEEPGVPEGFVIQLVGPPGIGKSTLLTQIAGGPLCKDVLYIASEEAASRIGRRARRLKMRNAEDIQITHTQDLPTALRAIREVQAKIVIVDSLQGMRLSAPEDVPGDGDDDVTVKMPKHTQQTVRDIAFQLIREAQKYKRTIFVIGHINKENVIAGLREIEFMVDIVSFFEGDPTKVKRVARCTKNREGDTMYKAHFKMTNVGLVSYDPKKEKSDEQDDPHAAGDGKRGRGAAGAVDSQPSVSQRRKETPPEG